MKNKKILALWIVVVLILVISQYIMLTNNKEEKIVYGKVIEDRDLTSIENEYFLSFFSSNKGFVENFYENVKDLNMEDIILKGQGLDKELLLTDSEYQKIMEKDLKDIENYEVYYNRPTELFTKVLSASNLRNMFKEKTLKTYSKELELSLFEYNKEKDVFYSTKVLNLDIKEYTYKFKNIKITNNNIYQISYVALLNNEEKYEGILSLKKDFGLYFVSNILTNDNDLVKKIKNVEVLYDMTIKEEKTVDGKDVLIYKSKIIGDGVLYVINDAKYYFYSNELILYFNDVNYYFEGCNLKYGKDVFEYNLSKNDKEIKKILDDAKELKELIEK